MKVAWTNNVAKVGGVEFEVWQEDSDWCWNVYLTKRVDVSTCEHMPLLNLDYYDNCYPTEAEARAAAEEIASEIFGGEEVWRSETDGKVTYHKSAHVPAFRTKVQRGIFVPLEGE